MLQEVKELEYEDGKPILYQTSNKEIDGDFKEEQGLNL